VRSSRPSVEGAVALELDPVAAISFFGGEEDTMVWASWWCHGGGGEDGGGFPSLAAHPL
jgi:hypothetical protein